MKNGALVFWIFLILLGKEVTQMSIIRRVILAAVVFALWLAVPGLDAQTDLRKVKPGDDFLIIGHMGAPLEEPDNTIESFQKALDLGANAIETDLCMTKDGYIVLWHDWDPDEMIANFRQLGKQGLKCRPYAPNLWERLRKPLPRLTLAEFRKGYGYTLKERGLGTNKKLPHKIPTIEEFCQWAAGQNRLEKILFDIKIPKGQKSFVEPMVQRLVKALDASGIKSRALLLVPNEDILEEILPYTLYHDLQVCFDRELPAGIIINPSKFSSVKKALQHGLAFASIGRPVATIMGYSIYKKIISYDLKLARIHNFATPPIPLEGIIAWTIDKPEEMRELITLGVRGILTNRPDVLKKVVDSLK
jgi:glycerophosphoryl diester phosphodiesterase